MANFYIMYKIPVNKLPTVDASFTSILSVGNSIANVLNNFNPTDDELSNLVYGLEDSKKSLTYINAKLYPYNIQISKITKVVLEEANG